MGPTNPPNPTILRPHDPAPTICPVCIGTGRAGVIVDDTGPIPVYEPCRVCGGSGTVPADRPAP